MKRSIKSIIIMGLMCGINLILSRYLVVYITDDIRISLGNLPIILVGVWFGPGAGMLVGGVSDLFGALVLSGRGWYPPLSLSPILIGFMAGIMKRLVLKRSKLSFIKMAMIVLPGTILASIGWTTFCLHLLYGTNFFVLLSVRAPLHLCIGVLEAGCMYQILKSKAFQRELEGMKQGKSGL